uniref:Uncharacterized protein n=1 Tax=Romanomermis culicivorax TaxID=13658 RepID=A0A915HN42_ROMCU
MLPHRLTNANETDVLVPKNSEAKTKKNGQITERNICLNRPTINLYQSSLKFLPSASLCNKCSASMIINC